MVGFYFVPQFGYQMSTPANIPKEPEIHPPQTIMKVPYAFVMRVEGIRLGRIGLLD